MDLSFLGLGKRKSTAKTAAGAKKVAGAKKPAPKKTAGKKAPVQKPEEDLVEKAKVLLARG